MTREEQHVADAIKALRAEFGESQQRFSDRIGVVVRTVARYEVQQPPGGEMLAKLAALTDEVGRDDLRAVFTNAFWRELNEELERATDRGSTPPRALQGTALAHAQRATALPGPDRRILEI
jgi:transcriptional regulator with XRE-family HTH domain